MNADDTGVAFRRVPQQPRSLKKVTTILETAMRLFQDSGLDQVSMREIAREADMPIATVYQYFPNKQAIVQQIWEGYTSAVGTILGTEIESFRADPTSQNVQRVIDRVVDCIADYHIRNPAFGEIRRCVDATPDLRKLNTEDTLRVADVIKTAIMSVNTNADESTVTNYALIASEATSATIRLGLEMSPKQRAGLYKSLKSFLLLVYEVVTEPLRFLKNQPGG